MLFDNWSVKVQGSEKGVKVLCVTLGFYLKTIFVPPPLDSGGSFFFFKQFDPPLKIPARKVRMMQVCIKMYVQAHRDVGIHVCVLPSIEVDHPF